jgi:hypothetical protein
MEQAGQLVTALQLTVKALQFYTADHPRVVEALVHLEQMYTSTLARAPRVTLTVARGALLVDGEIFPNPPAHVKMLASDLEKRHLGGVVLLAGATRRELLELVRLLSMRPEQIKAAGGADAVLNAAEVHHVRLSHVRYEAVTEQEEVVWSSTLRRMQQNGDQVTAADARHLIERTDAEQMTLLRERLAEMGMSREQFDELLDVIAWDKLSLDERVEKLLTGDRIFDFPPSKFQHFIRELLEAGRASDVHYLVERYVRGVSSPSVSIRQSVSDGLGQIVNFQLPPQTEQVAGAAILNHLLRESDSKVKSVAIESAANLLARLIGTGRCEPAARVLERLDAGAPGASAEVARAIAEAPRSEGIVGQIGTADADAFNRVVMPLVVRLSGTIAPALIEALGHEEDRNRRGRLVKALKAIGEPAFPALVETLRSQVWFVVRNALNVLGDIGTPDMVEPIGRKLDHGDARVRRAAARALSKIGGPEAEQLLIGAIQDRDPETQAEVLLCLGSMKAASAVPALTELLKPKGFFAREVPTLRAAAAKALAAIDTPAARDALRSVEPQKRA